MEGKQTSEVIRQIHKTTCTRVHMCTHTQNNGNKRTKGREEKKIKGEKIQRKQSKKKNFLLQKILP